jgi:Uma2 family endonuclease
VSVASAISVAESSCTLPIPLESLKRFTVEEYHALLEGGCIADDEDYELLEGFLVRKMGKKRRHSLATQWLRKHLEVLLQGYYVDAQEPITTGDSEPEPDASIVRGTREDYLDRQPLAAETVLVAEVAGRTLSRDRGLKKRVYARAAIPVYWIVNLINRQVEIYTEPSGPAEEPDYRNCQIVGPDGEVPVILDGREVGRLKVKDLLP